MAFEWEPEQGGSCGHTTGEQSLGEPGGTAGRRAARVAERPTMDEWLRATAEARPIPTTRTAASVIREMRDER
jgi:hypothetical protein